MVDEKFTYTYVYRETDNDAQLRIFKLCMFGHFYLCTLLNDTSKSTLNKRFTYVHANVYKDTK